MNYNQPNKIPTLNDFSKTLEEFRTNKDIPGMQIIVVKNENKLFEKNYSKKDVLVWDKKIDIDVNSNTLFRIASVTKSITAIGIMHLIELGKLKFDDKMINILIKGNIVNANEIYDSRMYDITIRDLLRHSGGWDTTMGLDLTVPYAKNINAPLILAKLAPFDPQYDAIKIAGKNGKLANAIDLINFMMHFPLNFTPGTREKYSNFGYNILGRIIEVITGLPYEEYIKKTIFIPSKFEHPAFIGDVQIQNKHPDEVFYYDGPSDPMDFSIFPNVKYRSPYSYGSFDLSVMDAHGGFVMTATDLVKIGVEMLNFKFFGKNIFNEILKKPSYVLTENKRFYSLGMSVTPMSDGDILISHNGALTFGTFAFLAMMPKKKIVVAAIMNHLDSDIGPMLMEFEQLVIKQFN